MFHRFICRCFVMLFGVPFFPLGCNYGMSSPGGKISFSYTQVKHFFNYTLLIRPQLKKITSGVVQNVLAQHLKNDTVSLQHCFGASYESGATL